MVRETFRRHDETPTLIESAHDLLGKRIGIATSLGLRVTFERDLMGDLAAAEAALPQGAPHRVALARDLEGRETTRRFSNGISVHSQRDDAGRITERRTDSPAAVLETVGYGWTDEGQLHWKVDRESRRGLHCFYDPRGRLIATRPPDAPGAREWRNPDLVGNLFRTPDRSDRRYGPGGVLLEADGTSYQHDADGYLVEKRASDGRTWRYAWNAEGCLHSVQTPDGQCVENLYDGLGRRVAKTLKDPSGATVKELRFVWDGDTIAHELSSDEEPTAWVFEPGSFTPLAKLQGQRRFGTVTDHLGTPEALYDEAGDLAWKAQLDLYGVCQIDVETTKQPWRWPGQYEDEETGLYYNRYRWYEPASGQYISRDPIGMDGGFAPYAYAPDPFGWIDPLGLMPWVNPTDSGHHIVPHSGASHLGIEHFNREHGVPSFFFPEPYSPSAHERLQGRGALERPPLTSRSIDRAQLTRRQWMDRLRRNYFRPEIQDIRGDLRIVTARGPGRVIASNVTPREAWIATMLWRAAQQEDPCG